MKAAVLIIMILFSASFALAAPEDVYLQKGDTYLVSGNYERAIKMFNNALQENPKCATGYNGLGMSYLKLGSNEVMSNPQVLRDAIKAFDSALSLKADLTDAHYGRGLVSLLLDDKNTAIKEQIYLRDRDKKLADSLLARIDEYKEPKKFKSVGSHSYVVAGIRIDRAGDQLPF